MNTSVKILWRHFRSGRLHLLLAAIIVATASLAAISMVAGSIHNTIIKQARYSLAADAQVRGSKPPAPQWLAIAAEYGLSTAQATQFRAMVFSAQSSTLASVKAVAEPYPMLGELVVSDTPYGENYTLANGPARGEAWLSPRLFAALGASPGDTVDIGEQSFRATRALVREPDSLQSAFNAAPRVMINLADVAGTGAVQLGSRVDYTLMLAGSDAAIARFKDAIELGPDFRWRTIANSNERLARTLNKATQFIRLGGILSIILAAIGIALATRSYASEQISQVALLKTLGATPRSILRLYASHIAIIAAAGTGLGLLLGYLLYSVIAISIRSLLTDLQPPNFVDLLFAAALSVSVFIVFATPYFMALRQTSPLSVLQQSHSATTANNRLSLLLGSSAAFALCAAFSGNIALTAYVFIGLAACCLLAVGCSLLLMYCASFLTRRTGPTVKLGISNLLRHKIHTAPQIMMFSMLFMLIFTLIMVRTSLLTGWQAQLPEDAPNHYVYNIFEAEKADILATLTQHDVLLRPVYPVFGGRLAAVRGEPAENIIAAAENHVNYEREFGLTWSETLGGDNRILAGQWWDADEPNLLLSVEEEFARGLNLEVGDQLSLTVGGSSVEATVASIRSVQWDSMNLNFYLIFNRPPVDVLDANWATSFYVAPSQKNIINRLARAHPTISIIELDQTINQVKEIISKVTLSIELITLLVLASGAVILLASVQSTYKTRLQEGAILRTFGASKRMVQRLNFIEFGAIGLASGLLATVGAEAALWFIGRRVLSADIFFHWPLWLAGPLGVMLVIVTLTSAFTRKLHQQTPMRVLKDI